MDILNSPLAILLAALALVAYVMYRKYSGADRRCGNCDGGILEELKAAPENILSSSGERNSLTLVRYNVTYKCNQCGETLTRTESRK